MLRCSAPPSLPGVPPRIRSRVATVVSVCLCTEICVSPGACRVEPKRPTPRPAGSYFMRHRLLDPLQEKCIFSFTTFQREEMKPTASHCVSHGHRRRAPIPPQRPPDSALRNRHLSCFSSERLRGWCPAAPENGGNVVPRLSAAGARSSPWCLCLP